jgi:hypothetical protein
MRRRGTVATASDLIVAVRATPRMNYARRIRAVQWIDEIGINPAWYDRQNPPAPQNQTAYPWSRGVVLSPLGTPNTDAGLAHLAELGHPISRSGLNGIFS